MKKGDFEEGKFPVKGRRKLFFLLPHRYVCTQWREESLRMTFSHATSFIHSFKKSVIVSGQEEVSSSEKSKGTADY